MRTSGPGPAPRAPSFHTEQPARSAAQHTSGRPYGGRGQVERVSERRGRFIAAGTQVFGTIGLRRATVRGLCAAAGLTDRYFYESFASLEALLKAVYEHQLDRHRGRLLSRPMPQPIVGEDPWLAIERDLRTCALAWLELVREPTFARIVLDEVLGVSPEIDSVYLDGVRGLAKTILMPAMARLPVMRQQLQGEQLELVGQAMIGAPIMLAKMWSACGYRQPIEAVAEACVQAEMGALQRVLRDLEQRR